MIEFTFDYIPTRNNKPVILLPIKCCEKRVSLSVLVDSGADLSISYKSIGEKFGMKFLGKGEEKVSGFWREGFGWAGSVKVFLDTNPNSKPLFIPVLWADRDHDSEEAFVFLLGRKGIFDEFNVEIRESERKVIFRKSEK